MHLAPDFGARIVRGTGLAVNLPLPARTQTATAHLHGRRGALDLRGALAHGDGW